MNLGGLVDNRGAKFFNRVERAEAHQNWYRNHLYGGFFVAANFCNPFLLRNL
jgi:hypothetical protein